MDECLAAFSDELGILPPVLWASACDLATRLCLWTAELAASAGTAISGRCCGVWRGWRGPGQAGGTLVYLRAVEMAQDTCLSLPQSQPRISRPQHLL